MLGPYYDDPALCALVLWLFTALAFGGAVLLLAPRSKWLLATLFAPLPFVLLGLRGHLAVVAAAPLLAGLVLVQRGRRPALVMLAFAAFSAVWAWFSPVHAGEALMNLWIGAACTVFGPSDDAAEPPGRSSRWLDPRVQDALIALVAMLVAVAATRWITEGYVGSGDEWANEYQAAVFAKWRATGAKPACFDAFRMFWVFWRQGRMFSQYTPGFPAVLAPFVALGISPYVQAPILALLAVGVSRLARRCAGARARSWIGPLAALLLLASTAVIDLSGTRYPHVLVATCFVLTLEAAAVVDEELGANVPRVRRTLLAAACIGLLVAECVATRPQDGLALGLGPAVLLGVALWRHRRVELAWQAALLLVTVAVGLMTWVLWTLRQQTGHWFMTGYDLKAQLMPEDVTTYSAPRPKDWSWPLPWIWAGYTWLPLSPVLGLAGLVGARRKAPRVVLMLLLSTLAVLAFYFATGVGRGTSTGPTARYQFVLVVPMAIGGALLLARLVDVPRGRAVALGFAVIALASLAVLAPRAFGPMRETSRNRSPLQAAVRREPVHHALVFGREGIGPAPAWDWTQNLPFDLYDLDVIYAVDEGPALRKCVREQFPSRKAYRLLTEGGHLLPLKD